MNDSMTGLDVTNNSLITDNNILDLKPNPNPPKDNKSKYVEAKTLAEMEFDVEEFKGIKKDSIGEQFAAQFNKFKKGFDVIMKDKKPAKRKIGPAQHKLFNPTMPVLRKPVGNRRG